MTPTQWMGLTFVVGAVLFLVFGCCRAAGNADRDAVTQRAAAAGFLTPTDDVAPTAVDDYMAVADALDDWGTWDRELAGGERG